MPTVTYLGPDDPNDPTQIFTVRDGEQLVQLHNGEATQVSAAAVDVLKAQHGHQFSFDASAAKTNPAGDTGGDSKE